MKTIANDIFFNFVEEEIAKGKNVRFRVKGFSMLPVIRNMRDDVILYPCKPDELKPLDIVLFRFNGRHILHRIIRMDEDKFIIQGDGIYAFQEFCTKDDIVGKVEFIIRGDRQISVHSKAFTRYSKIWYNLRGIRRYLLFINRVFTKIAGVIQR